MNAKKILSMVMSAAMLLTVSVGVNAEEKEPEVKITQTDISAEAVGNYIYKFNGERYMVLSNTSENGKKTYSLYDRKLEKTFETNYMIGFFTDDVLELVDNDYNTKRKYIDPYGNDIPELEGWRGHTPHGDYIIATYKDSPNDYCIIDKKGNIKMELPSEYKDSTNGIGNGLFYDWQNAPFPTGLRRIFDINGENVYVSSNAYYNITEEEITETNGKYDWAKDYFLSFPSYFSDGLIPVTLSKGNADNKVVFGYMDSDLNLVIDLTEKYGLKTYSENAFPFYDGYAPLNFSTDESEDKFGYIDKQGNMIIPEEYDAAYGYGNGLFSVGMDGKFGFVDKDNKAVVPLEYDDITQFVDGVAYGVKDGKLVVFEVPTSPIGDANGDGELNVRDCAFIASMLAQGKAKLLSKEADFNGDGQVNVRDAAAIAKFLATGKK